MDGQADYLPQKVKIVLLGDSYAGKTSIIDSYINKLFNSFYKVKIGLFSPQRLSTSPSKWSKDIAKNIAFSSGTLPDKNVSCLLPAITLKMLTV